MNTRLLEMKQNAVKYQVIAEGEERKNTEFLTDMREWLTAEGVDGKTMETILGYIEAQFEGLNQARNTVLSYMRNEIRELSPSA